MAFDAHALLSLPPLQIISAHTVRDTILYALGLGVGMEQPHAPDALRFVYEDGLQALPFMAAILASPGFWQKEPRYRVTWRQVLHAEQFIEWIKPLPVDATFRGEFTIDEIYDKGADKGALLYSSRKIYNDDTGELLAVVRQASFLRGDGGFGGARGEIARVPSIPDRRPDLSQDCKTRVDQALLYRLSGDYNPLHVDPAVAEAAGFERPVLHGLCTYGVAGLTVLYDLCAGDPARLRKFNVRFSKPVFPGQTIRTQIWRMGTGKAHLRAMVVETGVTVLDNGYVEFSE